MCKNAHEMDKRATSAKDAQVHIWSSCCEKCNHSYRSLIKKEGKMNISLTEDSSITELYARIESHVVKPTLKHLKSETVSGISYIYWKPIQDKKL